MLHIARDTGGTVVAVFANPQPDAFDDAGKRIGTGLATESVADDDAEVLEFLQRTAAMEGEHG